MSGEVQVVYGATKTLEANGGAITNNAIGQADDATYGTTVDGGGYPDAEFVLGVTFGSAPTEGAVIALYARPLDVDGSADTEVPEATRPTRYIGSFVVNDVTTLQYPAPVLARDVPELAEYYLHNNGTGQSISAGWTLKVRPRSYRPAA